MSSIFNKKIIVILDTQPNDFRYKSIFHTFENICIDLVFAHSNNKLYENVSFKVDHKVKSIDIDYTLKREYTLVMPELINFIKRHPADTQYRVIMVNYKENILDQYLFGMIFDYMLDDDNFQPVIEFISIFSEDNYEHQMVTSLLGYLKNMFYVSYYLFLKCIFLICK